MTRWLLEQAAFGQLTRNTSRDVIEHGRLESREQVAVELVDAFLDVAERMLSGGHRPSEWALEFRSLKYVLGLNSGDITQHGSGRVAKILCEQMEHIHADGMVDSTEALYQVDLQGMFDLSYDEYRTLTKPAADAIVTALVSEIIADGQVTAAERELLERRILALDTVYSISPADRFRLQAAGISIPHQ